MALASSLLGVILWSLLVFRPSGETLSTFFSHKNGVSCTHFIHDPVTGVLSNQKRSHRDVTSTHQLSMQGIVTIDTAKQQAFAWSIFLRDMSTFGASLGGVIGIDLGGHASSKHRLVGQHGMQLGKAPFRVHGVACATPFRDLCRFSCIVGSACACALECRPGLQCL